MTHYDNSGSEDGQLRSPGDEECISGDDNQDGHDNDILDIKPPQPTSHYARENKESKRHDKSIRDKKHSKEHRQSRDRNGVASDGSIAASSGGHEREREREREHERRKVTSFRDGRNELERYQRTAGGSGNASYDRNDSNNRYKKHYDRGRDNFGLLHHPNQQHTGTMHAHRRQQDYYERVSEYHHHGSDYHSMRTYTNKYHDQRNSGDYGHDMSSVPVVSNIPRDRDHDRDRDRRKYNDYEGGHQDGEMLEQDLRSRLLSKRHKYVKDYDSAKVHKHQMDTNSGSVSVSGYNDRSRVDRSFEENLKDRHARIKRNCIIEVLDSPDNQNQTTLDGQQHVNRCKRYEKERAQEVDLIAHVEEKQHFTEDLELAARRSKLLAAEREISRHKEAAREESELRREKKLERRAEEGFIDELSPTAVAANVTAGLNIVVKRHKNSDKHKKSKSKRSKHQHSDYEDEHRSDSETNAPSDADSEANNKITKKRKQMLDEEHQHGKRKKRKTGKHKSNDNQGNESDDIVKHREADEPTDDEILRLRKAKAKHPINERFESISSFKEIKSKRKHRSREVVYVKKYTRKHEIGHTIGDEEDKHDDNNRQNEDEDNYNEDEDDVDEDNDELDDLKVPDSPLSVGELSKSPNRKNRNSKNIIGSHRNGRENDKNVRGSRSRSRTRTRSRTSLSSAHSYSRSVSRSRSRSRSSSHRDSISSSSSESRTRSRSGSLRDCSSGSRSQSRSRTHSRSRSRTRSRSRSEERDMHTNLKNANEDAERRSKCVDNKLSDERLPSSPTLYDERGVILPNYYPGLQGCRSVEEFQCLNRIEEGTYGVVYRAKDKRTSEIVALKRLKMEKEKEGFPITSLREINTLLKGQHPNIVTVREIVVGSNMDKIFIVMDYVEHDLKSLMETMKAKKQCFLPGEVKCLTQQLLRAVGHLHDNWILHRDLKTSNLLLSHKGILKVGDFGLAREYGSPLKKYTSLVVTLWYRAPELLLCSPEYSTPIDIWSVGCIFGEFLQMAPLFPGKSEIDELNRIFKELGTPNEKIWPGYKDLPAVKNLLNQNSQFTDYPVSNLRKRFTDKTSDVGISFLQGLLTYDPKQRLNAEAALKHPYFKELPLPIDPSMFPTWPAKSELGARRALASSPKPPSGGSQFKQLGRDELVSSNAAVVNKAKHATGSSGFSGIITGNKKTATNTGFVLNAGIDRRQLAMGPGFNLKF